MSSRPPRSARRHSLRAALLARRAAAEAQAAMKQGRPLAYVAGVVATQQATAAAMAQNDVAQMLAEQGINVAAEALLNPRGFTTSAEMFASMVGAIQDRSDLSAAVESPASVRTQEQFDKEFQRLAASLVQDAGRAAEVVATAVRERIVHVRLLTPPTCSRCAVLAGRIYRYSSGFLRHTNCDCVMIPTLVANDQLVQDPTELLAQGLIVSTRRDKRTGQIIERPGLSNADRQAIADGADFNKVVNTRLRRAGLQQSGRVLARRGRLTPEGIYAIVGDDRERAVEMLRDNQYILPTPTRSPAAPAGGGGGGGGRPPTGPAPGADGGDGLDEEAQRIADALMTEARRIEPDATRHTEAAASTAGGRLEREDDGQRFKSRQSIVRKLKRFARRPAQVRKNRRRVNDAVRYTMVLDEATYWRAALAAIDALSTGGFRVTAPEPDELGWREVGYRGINLTITGPDGARFEVQLHTAASLAAAEATHYLYEEQRKLPKSSARWQEIERVLNARYARVPTPPGVPPVD